MRFDPWHVHVFLQSENVFELAGITKEFVWRLVGNVPSKDSSTFDVVIFSHPGELKRDLGEFSFIYPLHIVI